MIIDHVQVSGPPVVKTSVLNPVDLTPDEDDDVEDHCSVQARASSLTTPSSISPADKVTP